MKWYLIQMTHSEATGIHGNQLRQDFDTVFLAAHAPTEFALFCSRDPLANPFSYYLSIPDRSELYTSMLLQKHAASLCEKPNVSQVSLLIGNNAWDLLK